MGRRSLGTQDLAEPFWSTRETGTEAGCGKVPVLFVKMLGVPVLFPVLVGLRSSQASFCLGSSPPAFRLPSLGAQQLPVSLSLRSLATSGECSGPGHPTPPYTPCWNTQTGFCLWLDLTAPALSSSV